MREFDATITLNDHHLADAGMTGRKSDAVAAVRQAVERMAGAGWIDVEAHFFPPETPDWVILYPPGQSIPLDTPEWRDLRWRVEEVATAALREARPLP